MNFNDVSIVIITYNSDLIISKFIKKIPNKIKVIIIDNSNNDKIKTNLKNKKNIKIFLKKNNGVSRALNFAVKKISTKYFLQISPDIDFNFNDLQYFLNYAKKIKNRFSAIGPRFINVNQKSHKQISPKRKIGEIDSIHGSCMFVNKKNYEKIGGFDNKFFLYFEETDYCLRGKKLGLKSYQINKIKVKSIGRSVNEKNINELKYILIWHFIWSKYYYTKKNFSLIFTLSVFTPIMIRIIFRILISLMIFKKDEFRKYRFRLNGLVCSILGKKSYLRPR
tara:strand:+ start:609 stop:1445 length:837 start_codon:yes stop_codon:yes gene_type:complete